MRRFNPQLGPLGELRHFLTTEGLSRVMLDDLLHGAQTLANGVDSASLSTRIIGLAGLAPELQAVCSRAAQRLGAHVWSDNDPLAQPADLHVLAHSASGAGHVLARSQQHVVNAADGWHARPLHALADLLQIRRAKGGFTELRVAFFGDLAHCGRGRCLLHALTTLGAPELRLVAPRALQPEGLPQLGLTGFSDPLQGAAGVDVIIDLGLQPDSLAGLPSARDYALRWSLRPQAVALAQPDVLCLSTTPAQDLEAAAMGVFSRLLEARA